METNMTTEDSIKREGSGEVREGSGEVEIRGGGACDHQEGLMSRGSASPTQEEKPHKTADITLEMLSSGGYYDMPMSKVARLLGRTEGSFQRVCRGLGILRWPYRVRKSLQEIMAKTEEYLDDGIQEDGMTKAEVLKTLQAHMDDVKGISGNGMDKATKQYRQYIFKVNHKLARKSSKQGLAPEKPSMKVKGMLRAASKIQKTNKSSSLQNSEPAASLSRCHSGDGASCGVGGGGPAGEAAHSGSTEGSHPTRPTPRHFRDLPASLAFQPMGSGDPTPGNNDIVGRMATSAAVHKRLKPSTSEEYRRICLQDDQELLRLCLEMDGHLEAAQKALALQGSPFPSKLHLPLGGFGGVAGVDPLLQHMMHAQFPTPHLAVHPSWPQLPGGGVAVGEFGGYIGLPGGLLARMPHGGCL